MSRIEIDSSLIFILYIKSRKENPQKLTQLSSRSHPRHLVGKRTAQKDITKATTSDSQVNSNFPNRWSKLNHIFLLYNFRNHSTINKRTMDKVASSLDKPLYNKNEYERYSTCIACGASPAISTNPGEAGTIDFVAGRLLQAVTFTLAVLAKCSIIAFCYKLKKRL